MDVATVVGALFTLALAAVLVVERLKQYADRRLARVPVIIERINASTRSRNSDGPQHIL